MMKRDNGFDAHFSQSNKHFPVVNGGGLVKRARFWLQSAPFNRKTMGIVVQLFRQGKIFGKEFVMICRLSRLMGNQTQLLRPPPVVVFILAFDLMRGRRRAPKKVFREFQCFHVYCYFLSIAKLAYSVYHPQHGFIEAKQVSYLDRYLGYGGAADRHRLYLAAHHI